MSRHITDRPKAAESSTRLREYLRLERADGRHPATVALHQRPRSTTPTAKLRQFLRISRGQTA